MKLRAIHVGCGGFGARWVQVLSSGPPVEVVALVDVNRAVLEEAAERIGVSKERCFDSVAKALKAVEADLLINVTPPNVHSFVALKAFRICARP